MVREILVINPNSSQWVTDDISALVEPYRSVDLNIRCVTLAEGPAALSGYSDRGRVTLPIQALVAAEAPADAYVIACFGDPGLMALREKTTKPVFGIGECSFYTAMSVGDRFGILSTGIASVRRHERYVRELGLGDRFAGDMPIGMSMLDLNNDRDVTLEKMVEAGRVLKQAGAEALITGCAGMASFRAELQERLEMRVVEPAIAGVGMAASFVRTLI